MNLDDMLLIQGVERAQSAAAEIAAELLIPMYVRPVEVPSPVAGVTEADRVIVFYFADPAYCPVGRAGVAGAPFPELMASPYLDRFSMVARLRGHIHENDPAIARKRCAAPTLKRGDLAPDDAEADAMLDGAMLTQPACSSVAWVQPALQAPAATVDHMIDEIPPIGGHL